MFKLLFLVLISFQLNAEVEFWQIIEPTNDKLALEESFDIKPAQYQLLEFDGNGFEQHAKQKNLFFNLPMPDGQFIEFDFIAVDIMSPILALKFPNIHTYRGTSVDGLATAVLDVSQKGLHAVITHDNKKIWIDPINLQTNTHHISYYETNLKKTHHSWQCGFEEEKSVLEEQASIKGQLPVNELTLKTYRIAVAVTAEYTAFHSAPELANVNDGMAALVTAMNRVNGIYEVELGIRMILVDNNDQLVFLHAASDNLTNNNGSTLLSEIQAVIDNTIGNENYDIGHVFSTGGGGIAYHGVTCDNTHKARGVTGQPQPINDPFYVDYVAHEMGHQWGASHTFNSDAGFCDNQRVTSSAFEPGSGSTIMAYAGICSQDNLQNNSDAYFHSKTLKDITSFANNSATCDSEQNTNNQAPIVDAGQTYFIPKLTAFTLCAQASDVDSNNLTYNWEQYDTGPQGLSNNPVGNAPIFRSFTASSDNCRTFPKLENILNNTQVIGERLASYERDLHFNITVRDNELNGGAFNTHETQVSVIAGGPFKITSHNFSQGIVDGFPALLSWDVANTDSAPINCPTIDADVSLDGGLNFTTTTIGLQNNGSGLINIPNTNSTQIRIKIYCTDNIFFDINDANLFIVDDLIFTDGFE